jgi:DNA-binding transcriptional MerR regulator
MGGPYGTKDVEALIGVGEHVLRYWEKELPLLSPQRTAFGRREWSEADLALLLRVRHLVRDRGLSLHATLDALLAERSGPGAARAATLAEARALLVELFFACRRLRARASRSQAAPRGNAPRGNAGAAPDAVARKIEAIPPPQ